MKNVDDKMPEEIALLDCVGAEFYFRRYFRYLFYCHLCEPMEGAYKETRNSWPNPELLRPLLVADKNPDFPLSLSLDTISFFYTI